MSNPDMMEALQALAVDKGITVDTLFGALADALESAYKRMPEAHEYAWVTLDPDTGDFRVMAQELDEEGEPTGPELDVTPANFGRIAAQTAKQVMGQRIREAEREMKYEEYAGREGDIVTGIIQQSDSRYTLLDLGRVEALLPQAEQVPYERPEPNARVKACAREPGARTKIAVLSNDGNVDPVGACVGARGARVRMVVNELRGEKIDIVPFSDDPADFVMKALSPAKVKEVRIHEDTGVAEVIVPDYQLSLAIGKEGQNARLAARLTGWRVDIKSEAQLAEEEAYLNQDWAEGEWVIDPETGDQMWRSSDGELMTVEEWNAAALAEDAPDGVGDDAKAPTGAATDAPPAPTEPVADEVATPPAEPEPDLEGAAEAPTDASTDTHTDAVADTSVSEAGDGAANVAPATEDAITPEPAADDSSEESPSAS